MLDKISAIILKILLAIALVAGTFFAILYFGGFGKIPSKAELREIKNQTASLVFSSDGKLIGKYFAENRTNIPFEELPKDLVNALVATEDARYFEHEGVDTRSMIRVFFKSFLMGDRSSGGGSTLSQQLSKNLFGRKDYGKFSIAVNKFKEMILARRLEKIYSKEEILSLYLNTVPFGENLYGIEAASQRFFNTTSSQLKIEESAVLVGILKANTYYNPRLHPENALLRRNVVLSQMEKYDYLSGQKSDSLQKLPLELNYSNLNMEGPAAYFLVEVRKEAERILEEINGKPENNYDLEKDGLLIKTSLLNPLQVYALEAMKAHLSKVQPLLRKQYQSAGYGRELSKLALRLAKEENLDLQNDSPQLRELFDWKEMLVKEVSMLDSLKHALTQLHSGLIAMDPSTGAVLAWVGGLEFHHFPYDQIRAKRQLASTFKPILYAAAVESGSHACDYLRNDPIVLTDYDNWEPKNYDGKSGGEYSLAAALAFSKNIPTVNLFFQLGFNKLERMWKSLGFSEELKDEPSTALGTVSANLFEIATAYSSFANSGKKVTAYFIESIETADRKVIYQHKAEKTSSIMSKETALQINEILKKATNEGTGASMRSKYRIYTDLAGKTGTSQDFADAWYVCYNSKILLATRVGASYPNIHFNTGSLGSGSSLALPIAGICLKKLLEDKQKMHLLRKAELNVSNEINCEDFREDSALEEFFRQFKKQETTRKKVQKKRKKKNLFDRIFGK